MKEKYAQHDGRWFSAWIGYSFRRFFVGFIVNSEERAVSLGLGYMYLGAGLYERSSGEDTS